MKELQVEQNLVIFSDYLPDLIPVAKAFLISLQKEDFRFGGQILSFQTRLIICIASGINFLVPYSADVLGFLHLEIGRTVLQYKYR